MKSNFPRCLALSRVSEGGYSNHSNDAGGPTMKGITLAVFRSHRGINRLGIDDLKAITDAEVAEIYKVRYWDKSNCDALPAGPDYAVFDYALNSGPGRANKSTQKTVGVTQDGAIGPITVAAINAHGARQFVIDLCAERLAFMKRAKNSKTGKLLWPDFGRGWQTRVDGVIRDATAMVGTAPTASVILPASPPARQPDEEAPTPRPSTPAAPAPSVGGGDAGAAVAVPVVAVIALATGAKWLLIVGAVVGILYVAFRIWKGRRKG